MNRSIFITECMSNSHITRSAGRLNYPTAFPAYAHLEGFIATFLRFLPSMCLVRFLLRTLAQPGADVQPAGGLRTPAAKRAGAASLISPPGRSATTSARGPAGL